MALFQIPPLVKKRQWRELTAFSAFYVTALTMGILFALDVKIPNPLEGMRIILEDMLHLKYPE